MIEDAVSAASTFLFVPGDRPERFDKAASSGADVVILDLEDAVAPDQKLEARRHVEAWLRAGGIGIVRVNGRNSPWFVDDLTMVAASTDHGVVMLPKCTSDGDVRVALAVAGPAVRVVALIESAMGVRNAAWISRAAGVVRTAFGHIDFSAEIGIDPSARVALLHARSSLVYAAGEAGLPSPVDGVTTALDDLEQLRADCFHAKEMGFGAKLCIHPRQVGDTGRLLAPTHSELEWARAVVGSTDPAGVGVVGGHMVDAPVLARARRLLRSP